VRIVQYLKWMRLRDGGVVRAVLDLSAALAARGHQVTLLTADDGDVPPAWKVADGARPAGVPACIALTLRDRLAELRGGSAAASERDTVTQLLDRRSMALAGSLVTGADAVHVHGPWASSNIQVAALARRAGAPVVVSPHGMLDDWCMAQGAFKKRLHLRLLGRRMLAGAGAIHCTAAAELEQARAHFPPATGPGRLELVIPLPFDASPYLDLPDPAPARARFAALRTGRPSLLFLGRLNAIKGVERLIGAAALLRDAGTPVETLIAGPAESSAYEERLRSLAASLGLAETTHFLGMVTGPDKVSLYGAADVFVLPSSHENFGFVLLEAMAAGTPAVATRGVSIWPELEASGGAVIAGDEPAALAAAIGPLLADAGRRRAMGAKGRTWATTVMDGESAMRRYEAMYAGLRRGPRPGRAG